MKEMQKFDPEVARQLQNLLNLESDEEVDAMYLFFEVSYNFLGEQRTHELKKDGSSIPVTIANREEFVELYISYHMRDSVEKMSNALIRGFNLLIPPHLAVLDLFHPAELELLIVGTQDLDFVALEKLCEYEGNYSASSRVVRWFWKVIHELHQDQKQKFLQFATGSPRAPVGGLKELSFKIQRAGPDSDQLPSAHTCFNTILLPDYNSEEKLKRKLLYAINNCEGFFLE